MKHFLDRLIHIGIETFVHPRMNSKVLLDQTGTVINVIREKPSKDDQASTSKIRTAESKRKPEPANH